MNQIWIRKATDLFLVSRVFIQELGVLSQTDAQTTYNVCGVCDGQVIEIRRYNNKVDAKLLLDGITQVIYNGGSIYDFDL